MGTTGIQASLVVLRKGGETDSVFLARDDQLGTDYIHNAGIIRLKPGCAAITDSRRCNHSEHLVHYRGTSICTEISINLTQLSPEFGEPHLNILEELTHINTKNQQGKEWSRTEAAISLKNIEHQAQQLKSRSTFETHLSTGVYTGGSVMTLFMMAGAVLGILKLKPLCRRGSMNTASVTEDGVISQESVEILEMKDTKPSTPNMVTRKPLIPNRP